MNEFWQGIAAMLLAVVCISVLGSQNKDMALVLTAAACCLVGALAISYIRPVIHFVQKLEDVSNISPGMLRVLLKAVGIGFIGEVASMICTDSGHGALGKGVQMLTSAVIIWLSLPLMEKLLELIEGILGEI